MQQTSFSTHYVGVLFVQQEEWLRFLLWFFLLLAKNRACSCDEESNVKSRAGEDLPDEDLPDESNSQPEKNPDKIENAGRKSKMHIAQFFLQNAGARRSASATPDVRLGM